MGLVIAVIALVAAIWIGGHFLAIELTPKIVATCVVILAAIAWRLVRRLLAIRAARKLEREIAAQAALASSATRSSEAIEEMKKAFAAGLERQGRRPLPWLLVIGPKGEGKTSLIRASDLDFPLLPPEDANAPTEHPSFWLTDRAALVDTPGRYVTADGRDEWLAFLAQVKAARRERAISGIVVVVDGARLGAADAPAAELLGKRLRGCIDDAITQLESVVPVYLFLTNTDRLDGFEELFSDLDEAGRRSTLGVTLPKDGGDRPAKSLAAELARLVDNLHARALDRVAREPRAALRGPLLRFPAQLESLSGKIASFAGFLGGRNAFQETPVLRGAYLVSAAQGGVRVDRVFGPALAPFGLALDSPARARPPGRAGFFVHDPLAKVAFADGWIATPTESATRRRRQRTLRASALLLAASTLLLVPALGSHRKNAELVQSTRTLAERFRVRSSAAADEESFAEEASTLDAVRDRLEELERWRAHSPPLSMRWGLYTGDDLVPAVRRLYAAHLEHTFIRPAGDVLEAELRAGAAPRASAEEVRSLYPVLKTYLMLGDRAHLDPAWAATRVSRAWSKTAAARRAVPEDVKVSHAKAYLDLVKSGELPPRKLDPDLVEKARSALQQIPTVDRDYDALVRDASTEVAPITRESIFYGRVAGFVTARNGVKVDGAYTRRGWDMVRVALRDVQAHVTAESWVLGITGDRSRVGARDRAERLEAMYFERYKAAWRDFLADQVVERPHNAEIALDELSALTQPEWPYLRLVRVLAANTELPMDPGAHALDGSILQRAEDEAQKLLGVDGGAPAPPRMKSAVEIAFEPIVVFALPPEPAPGDKPPPAGLAQYQAVLAKLIGVLTDMKDAKKSTSTETAAAQFEIAYRTVASLLAEQTPFTTPLLEPLLVNPISLAWGSVVRDAAGVSGGIWELDVWRPLNDKLATKFPFVEGAPSAAMGDFTEMFRPQTGVFWSFYERDLKAALPYEGGRFVPNRRFGAQPSWSPAFLRCLERAKKITDATFPPKSEVPTVPVEVRLHSVSPKISEVELVVDGTSVRYKNHPEEWVPIVWPGRDAKVRGATLAVRGADDLNEELTRPGDFGLLELVASGDRTGGGGGAGGAFTSVFSFRALAGATVSVDFRPARSENPFLPDLFTGLRCPKDIVAR